MPVAPPHRQRTSDPDIAELCNSDVWCSRGKSAACFSMSSGEAAADVQAAALLVVVRRTGNTHSCCLAHDCTAELTNVHSCTGRRHESSSQTWSFMTRTASQCPCFCTRQPAKEESAIIAALHPRFLRLTKSILHRPSARSAAANTSSDLSLMMIDDPLRLHRFPHPPDQHVARVR